MQFTRLSVFDCRTTISTIYHILTSLIRFPHAKRLNATPRDTPTRNGRRLPQTNRCGAIFFFLQTSYNGGSVTPWTWKPDSYDNSDDIADNTVLGELTVIKGSGNAIKINSNSKSLGDFSATKRLQLPGTGSKTATCVKFTIDGAATLTVYAMSGKSGNSRPLKLEEDTAGVITTNWEALPGDALYSRTVNIDAGTYYLYSGNSGINVYGVVVSAQN